MILRGYGEALKGYREALNDNGDALKAMEQH